VLPRALIIAAVVSIVPISYSAVLFLIAPLIFDFLWFSFEAIARAQIWALLLCSPIILALKLWERLKPFIAADGPGVTAADQLFANAAGRTAAQETNRVLRQLPLPGQLLHPSP
jgi:hypothetical protein